LNDGVSITEFNLRSIRQVRRAFRLSHAIWHLTNSEAVILGALAGLVSALALWRDR